MNIDIFVPVTRNSIPYAEALRRNMNRLQTGRHDLRFHIVSDETDVPIDKIPAEWNVHWVPAHRDVPFLSPDKDRPSVKRGKILNRIQKLIPEDCDVLVISDCDMYMLVPAWDQFIVDETINHDLVITTKHDGSPRMFFMAIRPAQYFILQPDYLPGVGNNNYESGWVTNKAGRRVVADTGWRLEDDMIEAGMINPLKLALRGEAKYYVSRGADLLLVCAHMGGSHKKEFNTLRVQNWYKNNDEYIEKHFKCY